MRDYFVLEKVNNLCVKAAVCPCLDWITVLQMYLLKEG